mgnify:FL=1
MDIVERFKKYIAFDTMSSETSGTHPSSKSELFFGDILIADLRELGVKDILKDEHGYIYAHVNNHKEKTIGLIAHMDTAPTIIGGIKNPQIIEKYDGKTIKLNDEYSMNPEDFTALKEVIGDDLMVTDGTHLLGGDDKAGVVIIFEFLSYYINHLGEFDYNLSIGFIPDEEIGEGPMFFDVKKMNANIAYTLDGGTIYEASCENFNASSAVLTIRGLGVHPGSAKGVMINAALLGIEFNNMLPSEMVPSKTDNYEGFIHLTSFTGDVENAKLEYIIRDHDENLQNDKIEIMKKAAEEIQKRYPKSIISLKFKEEYKNMRKLFIKDPTAINVINKAYVLSRTKIKYMPIRGGTDGATISYMGLPCPNLGVGDFNPHGRFEFVSLTQMKAMVDIVKNIFKVVF